MKRKAASAETLAEKEAIMVEYADNLQGLSDALEKQKRQHLVKLRHQLLERRQKRKKVYFLDNLFCTQPKYSTFPTFEMFLGPPHAFGF